MALLIRVWTINHTVIKKNMLHISNKHTPRKKNIHHKSNKQKQQTPAKKPCFTNKTDSRQKKKHAHAIQSTFYTDLTVRHRIPSKLYLWTWSSSPRRPGRAVRWPRAPSRGHCCHCCAGASGSTAHCRCCYHSQVLLPHRRLLSNPLHGDRTLACLCNRLASTYRRLDR